MKALRGSKAMKLLVLISPSAKASSKQALSDNNKMVFFKTIGPFYHLNFHLQDLLYFLEREREREGGMGFLKAKGDDNKKPKGCN